MKKLFIYSRIITFFIIANASIIFAQNDTDFKPSKKVEGRIMYDFEFLNAGDSLNLSGSEFRRIRVSVLGKVANNIGYKLDLGFEGGSIHAKDIYINYALPEKYGNILIGRFIEPTNLDNLISSKYNTFMERSMMASMQPHMRDNGIQYYNYHLLDHRAGIQVSYTFNNNDLSGNVVADDNHETNYATRLFGVIAQNDEKNTLIHLGANYGIKTKNGDSYNYKIRFENHMGDKFIVHVGPFERENDFGLEAASTFGPLSIQGEYKYSDFNSRDNPINANGYYGFVSYFLTGEHRPYKKGTFGRVKPKKDLNFKSHSFGALELSFRYSALEVNGSQVTQPLDFNNSISNITAGLNWYLNPRTRIMYNFTHTNFNDLEFYGDNDLTGNLIRFQVDF